MSSAPSRVEKTESGLAFFGVIDYQSVPRLLQDIPQCSANETLLDLREVGKIDSAGLAFLLDWGNRNLAPDETIKLRGASEQARQLINILHLNSVFELLA